MSENMNTIESAPRASGLPVFNESSRPQEDLTHLLEEEEVTAWRSYMLENSDRYYDVTRRLIDDERFTPEAGIVLDNKIFLISKIMQSGNRKVAAGYVGASDGEGPLVPRLFYRSISDGGWRSTPGMRVDYHYSKGSGDLSPSFEDEYGHYVQITKPVEQITALLDGQMAAQQLGHGGEGEVDACDFLTPMEMHQLFSQDMIEDEQMYTLADEVTLSRVEGAGLDAFLSGVGFKRPFEAREELEAMELPDGFEPDFTLEPVSAYAAEHTLAGPTAVEVYEAMLQGRAIKWHMAHDTENRVWVDRITYSDEKVTTYGTRSEVLLAGALSAKPFDYMRQLSGMWHAHDWTPYDDIYGDVTPTLDTIPAIVRYRAARGIFRA